MTVDVKTVQKAVMGFAKRSEKVKSEILAETFVDTEPLADVLSTRNSQIIYGRRGTGKTHALLYLSEIMSKRGERPIYIDLRSIGSDGSIYNDESLSLAERSTRLVLDVLSHIGGHLYEIAIQALDSSLHPEQISSRLDDFEKAISEVKVVGESTSTTTNRSTQEVVDKAEGGLTANLAELGASLTGSSESKLGEEIEQQLARTGKERVTLNFGRVQGAFRALLSIVGDPTLWLLIDEWSEIPMDLQPYLADLLRRTVLPLENVVVKIAAIEHRSSFFQGRDRGEYVGLELGADVSADINLDDFLVFESNQDRSLHFFKNLLFRHLKATGSDFAEIRTPDQLMQLLFTQTNAFEELVRASEGVPRDALNLATKIVTKAFGAKASVADVRSSARDWYLQDKAAPVQSNAKLYSILDHIIDSVIGERKARAFLFKSNHRNSYIDRLYDARVIHTLKKNISSRDNPGTRYDAYKIDYGCYVELINTQKAPGGLFPGDEVEFIDVPVDDYRSIRRAILNEEAIEALVAA
jgi:hypothetical protein